MDLSGSKNYDNPHDNDNIMIIRVIINWVYGLLVCDELFSANRLRMSEVIIMQFSK